MVTDMNSIAEKRVSCEQFRCLDYLWVVGDPKTSALLTGKSRHPMPVSEIECRARTCSVIHHGPLPTSTASILATASSCMCG